MRLAEMMHPNGQVFLKSEWGPIGDNWPALSFGRKQVGEYLDREFKPGRDVLIYVGTSGKDTRDKKHRSRLLSAIVVQPDMMLETCRAIPPESWTKSVAEHTAKRWPYSFAIMDAAVITGDPLPLASDVIPIAYSSMGQGNNRGGVIQARGHERSAVMELRAKRVQLTQTADVQTFLSVRNSATSIAAPTLEEEAVRLANLITARVKAAGKPSSTINPFRTALSNAAVRALTPRKWKAQHGLCALCRAPMQLGATNRMLQPSIDRIVSSNPAYDDANVQLTHLGCNWAKNACSMRVPGDLMKVVPGKHLCK